jgi:small subunit ribosomal protein S2
MEQQERRKRWASTSSSRPGVHFGHQTRRWNPKMRKYIFTERNGIHIIDLRKTLDRLRAAEVIVRRRSSQGGAGPLRVHEAAARGIVEEEAERCGSFYVTERWLGGMLTNFQTIRQQIRRLKELERGQEENAFEFYTKKEQLLLDRERLKLDKYFSGVKDMGRLPGAIFVVDAKREVIAVKEANRLGIPVIAITDTNADPDRIDFPIPGNDDAIRSVGLITRAIADAMSFGPPGGARGRAPPSGRGRGHDLLHGDGREGGRVRGCLPTAAAASARPRPEVIAQLQKSDRRVPPDAADGPDRPAAPNEAAPERCRGRGRRSADRSRPCGTADVSTVPGFPGRVERRRRRDGGIGLTIPDPRPVASASFMIGIQTDDEARGR